MRDMEPRFEPHNVVSDGAWSVAIYVRLSDEDRDKKNKNDFSQSIQNQIAYIEKYIEDFNIAGTEKYRLDIYETYIDDNLSGMNFERYGFQQMVRDIEENKVDCIIAKNLSRIGRENSGMLKYLQKDFEEYGREVRVIAIGDRYDSLYNELEIGNKFVMLMNEEYSAQQHRNIIKGLRVMQHKGQYVAAFAPYGYKKDPEDKHHLVTDPVASEVVKRIFKEYISGVSPKEIAFGLTKDGLVNPSAYKKMDGSNYKCGKKISDNEKHWRSDGVKKILMDEVYTGTLVQHKRKTKAIAGKKTVQVSKKDWIRSEGTHEAIVSKDDWDIVQSMMKTIKRDTNKKEDITIFKGLLACGDCGHAMRKRVDTYKSKKADEISKYLYYNCSTFRDFSGKRKELGDNAPKCTSHYISDKLLRGIVIDDINKIIGQVQNLEEMVKKNRNHLNKATNDYELEIQRRKKKIEQYKNRLKGAKNKWYDGKISDEEYETDKAEIEAEIKQVEVEVALLKKKTNTTVSDIMSNEWIKKLLENGRITELDRETVIELIDKIYVYEDKHIEIVYKFSDEFDDLFDKEF